MLNLRVFLLYFRLLFLFLLRVFFFCANYMYTPTPPQRETVEFHRVQHAQQFLPP